MSKTEAKVEVAEPKAVATEAKSETQAVAETKAEVTEHKTQGAESKVEVAEPKAVATEAKSETTAGDRNKG